MVVQMIWHRITRHFVEVSTGTSGLIRIADLFFSQSLNILMALNIGCIGCVYFIQSIGTTVTARSEHHNCSDEVMQYEK